eukprot:m.357062 g.357062  ORF g.357062 m.357062 type:complete len:265 (-) comp20755_c0_seq27:3160-3954(-)
MAEDSVEKECGVVRIHLWAPPRSCSTSLMYSFGNRKDTLVVDEPLYAHFLKKYPTLFRDARERNDVMKTQSSDWNEVVEKVLRQPMPTGKTVLFIKHMAKQMFFDEDHSFIFDSDAINVLLLRDPVEQLTSWHRTKYDRTIEETGVTHQFQLYSALKRQGVNPVVVDSRHIQSDPQGVLSELCNQCNIPFDENMLEWPAGPRKEDGAWAYYYYTDVHKSTKLHPPTHNRPFPSGTIPNRFYIAHRRVLHNNEQAGCVKHVCGTY